MIKRFQVLFKKKFHHIGILMSLAIIFAICACARPTNPEAEKAASNAADLWMTLIDANQYQESWNASAKFLQDSVSREEWIKSLSTVRKPLGEVQSRKIKSIKYRTSLKDTPEGHYVIIKYKTAFSNKEFVEETITSMMVEDGNWLVVGYYLKSGSGNWLQDLMDR